jgi:hypothetical protein
MASVDAQHSLLLTLCWQHIHHTHGHSRQIAWTNQGKVPTQEHVMGNENQTANQSEQISSFFKNL